MFYIGQVPTTVLLFSTPVAHAMAVNTAGFKGFHLDSVPGLHSTSPGFARCASPIITLCQHHDRVGSRNLDSSASEPAPPAATIEVGVETRVGACRRVPLM